MHHYNQASKLDNYPIPKTEDLLTTLGDSQKFTKLHMSQAYQQLLLDEESKQYTTIYIHTRAYTNTTVCHLVCHQHQEFSSPQWRTCYRASPSCVIV
jgi:uncharacterized membrane-anchored protein YhcB (DUF1043 family)